MQAFFLFVGGCGAGTARKPHGRQVAARRVVQGLMGVYGMCV